MWLLKGYPDGEYNLLLKDYNVIQVTFQYFGHQHLSNCSFLYHS